MHVGLIGLEFKTNIGDGKLRVGTLNNHNALKSINDYRLKADHGTCKQTHFQKIR